MAHGEVLHSRHNKDRSASIPYEFRFAIGIDNIAIFELDCKNDEKAKERLKNAWLMVTARKDTVNNVIGEVVRKSDNKIIGRVGAEL